MDFSGSGQSPNGNGTSIWPGTTLTGPLYVGNVLQSDGSGNLAGLGEQSGTANLGTPILAQTAALTQTGVGNVTVTPVVIPAQSQINAIHILITRAWDGGNTTFNLGTTGNSTAYGATGAVQGNATGQISITPASGNATQIANWENTGNTDIQFELSSVGSGNGTGILTVSYLQSINN